MNYTFLTKMAVKVGHGYGHVALGHNLRGQSCQELPNQRHDAENMF